MAKIFISYSRASKDVIEELVRDLTSDDHEIWFDQHLTGGQKWWDNILAEIRKCNIFIAALTPESLKSRACQREAKYATDLKRTLLPVRLSDKVLPEFLPPDLSVLQWVDYIHPDKQALKGLQRTLRHLPKAPPLPDPLPHEPPVPISYLSSLRAKVDADSQLKYQDQIQLVFELRQQFRKGDHATEIKDLLQRLKRRDDLFARVLQGIDDLLLEIDGGRSGEELVEPPKLSNPEAHPPSEPTVDTTFLQRRRLLRAKSAILAVIAIGVLLYVALVVLRDRGGPAPPVASKPPNAPEPPMISKPPLENAAREEQDEVESLTSAKFNEAKLTILARDAKTPKVRAEARRRLDIAPAMP